jgi:hypothetical protein
MPWESGWEIGVAVQLPSIQITAGDPGIDTTAAGALNLGSVNATSVNIDPAVTVDTGPLTLAAGDFQAAPSQGLDTSSVGTLRLGQTNAGLVSVIPNLQFSAHLISAGAGTPATSALGANVTSAIFTGNDTRGIITIVMSGALAANTAAFTATFAASYGATAPKVTLVDQTSAVGLTIVNSYVLSQSTGVSFIVAFDQALAAGTYIIDYIVIG